MGYLETHRNKNMIEEYDEKIIRCPRIGGDVNFIFCRTENNFLPCRWIVGCWQTQLDIQKFFDEHYSEEEQKKSFISPKPKLASLVEMIEKVKEHK
jgi:hypothetical protein